MRGDGSPKLQERVSQESLGRWGASAEGPTFHSPVRLTNRPGVYWGLQQNWMEMALPAGGTQLGSPGGGWDAGLCCDLAKEVSVNAA